MHVSDHGLSEWSRSVEERRAHLIIFQYRTPRTTHNNSPLVLMWPSRTTCTQLQPHIYHTHMPQHACTLQDEDLSHCTALHCMLQKIPCAQCQSSHASAYQMHLPSHWLLCTAYLAFQTFKSNPLCPCTTCRSSAWASLSSPLWRASRAVNEVLAAIPGASAAAPSGPSLLYERLRIGTGHTPKHQQADL